VAGKMNEPEIRRLVVEWHQRSRRERDPTSKFVFLWFCFNAWLAFESERDTDREMIDWLKGPDALKSRTRASFVEATASSTFQDHLNALAALSPIEGSGRRRKTPVLIASGDDFGAVVEGIYRIRCNLFHGGTSLGDVRDQKSVIVASRILEKWVGNLVAGR